MFLKLKIWLYIVALKFWYGFGAISTKVIYAQAVHETGNFTSKVFKENNNLFGMREPKVRKTFATGTANSHATFKNLFDSVRDYFERQKNFKISSRNDSEFIDTTLASNYAEDRNYKSKWLNHIQGVKPPVSNLMIYGLFFFILLAFYLLFRSVKTGFQLSSNNQKIK